MIEKAEKRMSLPEDKRRVTIEETLARMPTPDGKRFFYGPEGGEAGDG